MENLQSANDNEIENKNKIIKNNFVLNAHQIMDILGISRGTLDKFRKEANFPKSVGHGGRPKWLTKEILSWIQTRD